MLVLDGVGYYQQEGESVSVLRKGDQVQCPPNVKHWHGASPTVAMAHIGIQELLDGVAVAWLEQVTDEEYGGG